MEKKISLRVSDEDLEIIDSFINRHDFKNRSAFIREAAMDYINRYSMKGEQKEVPARINLPKKIKNSIHYLIAMGHYDNWESAIKQLVKKGILNEDLTKIRSQYEVLGDFSSHVENILEVQKESEREYLQK